jgi:hypothetical protein
MNSIAQTTSFMFQGLDWGIVAQRYGSGTYSQVTLPTHKVRLKSAIRKTAPLLHSFIINQKTLCLPDNVTAATNCNWCRRFRECPCSIIVHYSNEEPVGCDQFCGPPCAIRAANKSKFVNASYYTRLFYGEDITPAKPWRMLKQNGGSMSDEDWDNPQIRCTVLLTNLTSKRLYEITHH